MKLRVNFGALASWPKCSNILNSDIGKGGQRQVEDIRLSRYACYLYPNNLKNWFFRERARARARFFYFNLSSEPF